jgi:hypothetical protein
MTFTTGALGGSSGVHMVPDPTAADRPDDFLWMLLEENLNEDRLN